MSLTERQRDLVTSSFARLVPISNEATSLFYERLWQIAPETKPLFHHTDMDALGLKLMQTLGLAVRSLHDTTTLTPLMRELGQRHIGYGVSQEQYEQVKGALLWMIEKKLGRSFNQETREAWIAAYDLIASIAISAYEQP